MLFFFFFQNSILNFLSLKVQLYLKSLITAKMFKNLSNFANNKTNSVVNTGSGLLVAVDCVLDGVMLNVQSCLVVPLQTLVVRVL
jgi:hypothetical protein